MIDGGSQPLVESSLTWPAEAFYWAVLDAPGLRLPTPCVIPMGLVADLADEVPLPVEDLHAVCAPFGSRLLVCAARRSDLRQVPEVARELRPSSAPKGLSEATAALGTLNLLIGEFEPPTCRRARVRRHVAGLTAVALIASLLTIGLARRAAHWSAVAQDARLASARVAAAAMPGVPPEAISAEVARLQQASHAAAHAEPAADAAVALASLLRDWPASAPCRPQSITVNETGMTVSVLVEGEAGPFLRAFVPPSGWRLNEPRLNAADSLTRVVIELRPIHSGGGLP